MADKSLYVNDVMFFKNTETNRYNLGIEYRGMMFCSSVGPRTLLVLHSLVVWAIRLCLAVIAVISTGLFSVLMCSLVNEPTTALGSGITLAVAIA